MDGLAQSLDLVEVQAQRLANIAQRAFRPVADHRGGQGGAFTAVFFVDVLNDFLAPLMLEIHVDVRWFVALPGNEALEQGIDARRIDFSNAEAIAHRRVRRRATPLAENVARACKADDIVYREKIRFVAQLGNQRQFVFQQLSNPGRCTVRPASFLAG